MKCGVRASACFGDGCGIAVDFPKFRFEGCPKLLAIAVP
jgi:hypothetical protein